MATSKKEHMQSILAVIEKLQGQGVGIDEILENHLTLAQYDFLVDNGVDTDKLTLTEQQQKNVKAVLRQPRPTGLKYNKKYPKEKQEIYKSMAEHLRNNGAQVSEHENFRDLVFEVDGKKYKIVLSVPRS